MLKLETEKKKSLLRNQITILTNGIQPLHVAFSENPIHTTHSLKTPPHRVPAAFPKAQTALL